MKTGKEIRKAREERGLSLRELAEKAGVAVGTVFNIESGKVSAPHASSVRKLLETLAQIPKLPKL